MSKDFATAAGALWSRLAVETGVETSIVICGHYLGLLSAEASAKRARLIKKMRGAENPGTARDVAVDYQEIESDIMFLSALTDQWVIVRKNMDVRPGSMYYLITTTQIQAIVAKSLEVAVRQDLIDIPDVSRFASYRPEGD